MANKERSREVMLSGMTSLRRLFQPKGVDLRANEFSRRWADLYFFYVKDCGGEGHISEAKRTLVRRLVTMQCVCEQHEAAFVTEGKANHKRMSEYRGLTRMVSILLKKLNLTDAKVDNGVEHVDPVAYANGGTTTPRKARQRLEDHTSPSIDLEDDDLDTDDDDEEFEDDEEEDDE